MKKRTRADKGKRRSHHALEPKTINKCPKCAKPVAPHTACAFCGTYRFIKEVETKATKTATSKKPKSTK
jgi:large subunit ribosomal protein L32